MREELDLPLINRGLFIDYDKLNDIKDELESFLSDNFYLNNRDFAKKLMFSHEIKSNNTVEGIYDDLSIIEKVISDTSCIKNIKQRKRIINLYNGYKYILTHKIINEEHLRELYNILSDGLLEDGDIARMGKYYRQDKVYILLNGRIDMEPDHGINHELIDKYMKIYFDFINDDISSNNTMTDYFIKSQIMHFYLVFIHPYFDVNGRTSRTTAMWYLIKNKAYPYIIFNRATVLLSSVYDKTIINAKKFGDVTYFVKYMMENVKVELEKEMIMHDINSSIAGKMNNIDYQSLMYILSMNDDLNVLNFATMYNRYNDNMSVNKIYEEMIVPLIDKGIICVTGTSKKSNFTNEMFKLNDRNFDRNNRNIKRLKLDNKI